MPLGVGALFFIYVPTDMLQREYLIYCRHCITDTGAEINTLHVYVRYVSTPFG